MADLQRLALRPVSRPGQGCGVAQSAPDGSRETPTYNTGMTASRGRRQPHSGPRLALGQVTTQASAGTSGSCAATNEYGRDGGPHGFEALSRPVRDAAPAGAGDVGIAPAGAGETGMVVALRRRRMVAISTSTAMKAASGTPNSGRK